VKSHVTDDFVDSFRRLPKHVRKLARKNYRLWQNNPYHPGVDFKQVGKRSLAFSVRVGIGWRALGVKRQDTIIWFWIGSHANYEKILKQL